MAHPPDPKLVPSLFMLINAYECRNEPQQGHPGLHADARRLCQGAAVRVVAASRVGTLDGSVVAEAEMAIRAVRGLLPSALPSMDLLWYAALLVMAILENDDGAVSAKTLGALVGLTTCECCGNVEDA